MTGNRGRWVAADECGSLNLVTEDVSMKAVGLVRTGRSFSLRGVPVDLNLADESGIVGSTGSAVAPVVVL